MLTLIVIVGWLLSTSPGLQLRKFLADKFEYAHLIFYPSFKYIPTRYCANHHPLSQKIEFL